MQEGGKRRYFLSTPSRQTIFLSLSCRSCFSLAELAFLLLSSFATVDNVASAEDDNIDLYEGILSTVLENPLILHQLILFRGCPGGIKSSFCQKNGNERQLDYFGLITITLF